MKASVEMPQYQSHKKVRAAEIMGVGPTGSDGATVLFLGAYGEFTADEKMTARYHPSVGDYLVKYDDGYLSISPKAPFDEGYTKC